MLPTVLSAPPWRPARVRKVLELDPSVPEALTITDAERASWLDPSRGAGPDALDAMPEGARTEHILALFEKRGIVPMTAVRHLHGASLHRAIALSDATFIRHYRLLERLLALEGLAAMPALHTLGHRIAIGPLLLRIDSHVATRDELARGQILHRLAAHPRTAARVLLAAALGPSGALRDKAVRFIVRLAPDQRAPLQAAAAELGPDAAVELEELWKPEPLPARAPKLPAFLEGVALPVPLLAGGEPLPPSAQSILIALLSLLPNGAARDGIEASLPALQPSSCARLADALLERWLAVDGPIKEKWVLPAVGLLGGEAAARRLVELGQEWATSGKGPRASLAFDAVGEIGSDVALMHLDHAARTTKNKPLKKRAGAVLEAVREERGWSEDELADRLVPTLGLGADGFLPLALGARRFRIGLDEALVPVALDDGGHRLPSLPRAKKDDDPAEAAAFTERLTLLKKDAKLIAQDQVRRLERALAAERRWSEAAFRSHLWQHPVMTHLARRLVWQASDGTSFRCTEDGTLATVTDDAWALPAGATVALAHPLVLGAERTAAWGNVFGDYQLLQPFPQLDRETFQLTTEERTSGVVKRFEGSRVAGGRFFSLQHRGWGFQDYDLSKALRPSGRATLHTEPGLRFLGTQPEDQTLGLLELSGFDGASEVALSEVLRDVTRLFA